MAASTATSRHPGGEPAQLARGYERAKALGVEGSYTLIPGALHGIAVRGPWGRPFTSRARGAWARYVASAVETWAEG